MRAVDCTQNAPPMPPPENAPRSDCTKQILSSSYICLYCFYGSFPTPRLPRRAPGPCAHAPSPSSLLCAVAPRPVRTVNWRNAPPISKVPRFQFVSAFTTCYYVSAPPSPPGLPPRARASRPPHARALPAAAPRPMRTATQNAPPTSKPRLAIARIVLSRSYLLLLRHRPSPTPPPATPR